MEDEKVMQGEIDGMGEGKEDDAPVTDDQIAETIKEMGL